MPELPEVETVKQVIRPQITGQSIRSVRILHEKVIAYPGPDEFAERLRGKTITGMRRRGKFLCFHFDGGERMVLHLRMTGHLLVLPAEEPVEKHTHLILNLSDGKQLRFIDLRRFGRFWLLRKGESDAVTGVRKLGPEPSSKKLTAVYLKGRIGTSRRSIKEALLDQTVVAGIGNIYSDEILFTAGIRPKRNCAELSDDEWERLAETIPRLMAFMIRKNRIPAEDYTRSRGREYRNTPYLKVYGHAGEPCPNCGAPLEKNKIGGRSSVFCPNCQK